MKSAFFRFSGVLAMLAQVILISGLYNLQPQVALAQAAPVNQAPVAVDQSVSIIENAGSLIVLSATDADNDTLIYATTSNPTHGTLSTLDTAGGGIMYTPDAGYVGPDSFTFKANDGQIDSNTATVSITINAVTLPSCPDGGSFPVCLTPCPVGEIGNFEPNCISIPVFPSFPTSADVATSTDENASVMITLTATDSDGDTLAYATTSNPAHGTLSTISGNQVTYTPDANYTGADSFTFKATDSTALDSNISTVSITVNAVSHGTPLPACDTNSTFDAFTLGSINGQGGWSATGPYDQAVVSNTYGFSTFGCQTLRISNAITSGSFGDWIFSPSVANEAGETAAVSGGMSGGVRQTHFDAQFDLASAVPSALQPGMYLSVSPDRGDGARMSYLKFVDQDDGIHVLFDDAIDAGPVGTTATFNESDIATLDRSLPHTIKFSMDFVDGPSNDVVKIYIDGALVHTGTSWEDYYRFDPEQTPSGNEVPTVDSLIFQARTGSGPVTNPDNAGKGFLVDNVSLTSSTPPPAHLTIVKDTDDNSGDGTFNFAVLGTNVEYFKPLTLSTEGGQGTSDVIDLAPGEYDVDEVSLPENWHFARAHCVYDNESVGVNIAGGDHITVDNGDNVTCTFHNTTKAVLTVKKVVVGSDESPSDFSFEVQAGDAIVPPQAFEADGENDLVVNPGTYTVTEVPADNFTTTYDNCSNVELGVGGAATCTITNTFVPPAAPETPSSNGGGGGGGGNGPIVGLIGGGAPVVTPVITAASSTGGQVLGAQAYNFANFLTVGSTGEDVNQLQSILIADGYLSISAPTGYFGPLTEAAVKEYQGANDIAPQSGYVGPLTLAELNKGTLPTTPETASNGTGGSLSDTQINAIVSLLQSFGADASTIANVSSALHSH